MTESDATLVAQAKAGIAAAFETLLRRHFRAAFLVAMAQLGERSDADDACQDAFVQAWQRLDDCHDGEKFRGWLLRIVRNTAHNRRDYLRVRAGQSLSDVAVADPAGADTALYRAEMRNALWAALRQLSPGQREVVLLHDLEGWRHAEIAKALEMSEAMSRRSLSDARRKLRLLLAEQRSDG